MIDPTPEQLARLAAIARSGSDPPLVMLNLNRYRERARYESEPPGGEDAAVSGREAYARYGLVALEVIKRVGGEVVWSTAARLAVVGEEEERFDEVVAVRYPSARAFLELAGDGAIAQAKPHRDAGLERALVLCCEDAGAGPLRGI